MATYKLIQDIEAEDHILGPLSLRQFIFALIAVFFGYLCFIAVTKKVPFLLALFLPPSLFFAFFAFPFGKDQPTEIWFLAKLRFWFLPRNRVWDQSGMKELVTITVPKKVERILTDGLSQTEVKSRLNALANTIDSRGWAVKNVSAYTPAVLVGSDSDRLIDLSSIPQDVPSYEEPASSDILDSSSPVAQQVDDLVSRSAQDHRDKLVQQLSAPATPMPEPPAQNWFTNPAPVAQTPAPDPPYQPSAFVPPPAPDPTPTPPPPPDLTPLANDFLSTPVPPSGDEAELAKELKEHADSQGLAYGNMHTLVPAGDQPFVPPPAFPTDSPAVTTPSDPAILALASNNDLNVDTLARQAQKAREEDEDKQHPDEVVISLH